MVVAQALGIVDVVTFGGFFITTVLLLVTVPHSFLTSKLIVYVPGFVNEKDGLIEEALVPLVK